MGVLVISKSFIVREALNGFFNKNFTEYEFKSVKKIEEVSTIDLSNIKLVFIDMEKDIVHYMKMIKDAFNEIKIIVFNKDKNKNIFTKCLKNKIESCLFDIDESDELLYIVRRIIKGKKHYDLDILDEIMFTEDTFNNSSCEMLTERETEVLHMVGSGATNKEIAGQLYISEHTVKKHITNILGKLDMKNRKDLIIYTKDKLNKEISFQ
ncbi:CsgBAC operon transcriptional regulatory protein [Turicibacter sanguinis]|nr:CsgBAC operon transcriptional regulatory protein [Turicibacter sanguinis]